MHCVICGKEIDETELGKQYCYDCEKKWLDDDKKVPLSYYMGDHDLFMQETSREENDQAGK